MAYWCGLIIASTKCIDSNIVVIDCIPQIVNTKKEDLNANSDEAACRIIEGTARSMGIEII